MVFGVGDKWISWLLFYLLFSRTRKAKIPKFPQNWCQWKTLETKLNKYNYLCQKKVTKLFLHAQTWSFERTFHLRFEKMFKLYFLTLYRRNTIDVFQWAQKKCQPIPLLCLLTFSSHPCFIDFMLDKLSQS